MEGIGNGETLCGRRVWCAPKDVCPPRGSVDDFQNRNGVVDDDFLPRGCVSEDVDRNFFKRIKIQLNGSGVHVDERPVHFLR